MAPSPILSALAQLVAARTPLFTQEGDYTAAMQHNAPYAKPGPYQTQLSPGQVSAYAAWLARNHVQQTPDYDMAGFFNATGGAPHQPGTHFPDTFKTPLDTSFSNESRYARPTAPAWQGDQLVDQRTGQVVFGQPVTPAPTDPIARALAARAKR